MNKFKTLSLLAVLTALFIAAGDVFYLMTAALDYWFLRRHEKEEGGAAAICIADIREEKLFLEFVQELRGQLDLEDMPYLRNDDVTFLRIEVDW